MEPKEMILTPDMLHEPVLVIRVAQQLDVEQLSPSELYNRTRGYWRVTKEYCERAHYVLSVSGGIVREVYRVAGWFNAGETFNPDLEPVTEETKVRIEFVGNIAPEAIRSRYLGRTLKGFWGREQNAVLYFEPETL